MIQVDPVRRSIVESDLATFLQALKAWQNHLRLPKARIMPRMMPRHECSPACGYFQHNKTTFVCEQSANVHICDTDHCKYIIETPDFAYCPQTFVGYPLTPVEEDPKRKSIGQLAALATQATNTPGQSATTALVRRQSSSTAMESESIPSTGSESKPPAPTSTLERKLIPVDTQAKYSPTSHTTTSHQSTRGGGGTAAIAPHRKNPVVRPKDLESLTKTTHTIIDRLLLQTEDQLAPRTQQQSARRKGTRQHIMTCRRMKERVRRPLTKTDLTPEFYERMAATCLKTWRTLISLPEFIHRKTYTFTMHCVVVLYAAHEPRGFRSNLFSIPHEKLLAEGFPRVSKLKLFGFDGFNDALTTFTALTGGGAALPPGPPGSL